MSLWREGGGPGGGLKGRMVVGKKLEKVPAHHPRPQTSRVKELSLFSAHKRAAELGKRGRHAHRHA